MIPSTIKKSWKLSASLIPHLSLWLSLEGPASWSHHRNTLLCAVKGGHHIGSLDAVQRRAQQSQSGALSLGPVRQERVRRGLAASEQVQLFRFVAQRCTKVPPSTAACLLQEALHLLLFVRRQVDVQTVVELAVSLGTCLKNKLNELKAWWDSRAGWCHDVCFMFRFHFETYIIERHALTHGCILFLPTSVYSCAESNVIPACLRQSVCWCFPDFWLFSYTLVGFCSRTHYSLVSFERGHIV